MNEWPLLIFTISMQAAIGGVLSLWIFHNKIVKSKGDSFQVMRIPLLVIVALSFIGLGASFVHLGTPTNAFNTILGFGHSWMSREIVFTGMFIGLASLTAVLSFVQKKVNSILLLVTAIVGLVDVYCMSAIYSQTLVNGWGHMNTFMSFYGTTFTLGSILAASLLVPSLKTNGLIKDIIKTGFYLVFIGIAVQFIGAGMFSSFAGEMQQINGVELSASLQGYESTIAVRWIIELVGIALLAYISLTHNKKATYSLAYVALLAILIGEGMSRYVFYILGA